MSTKLLQQIGLTEDQAKIYSNLVHNGALPARKIATQTGINRSLVYKLLKELIEFGLVTEHTEGLSVSKFSALHPSRLQSIVDKKAEDFKLADQALAETVSALSMQFNITCGKPTVHFYEGAEGVALLNKDILRTKSDIQVIRSPFDNNTEELDKHAKKLLEDRAKIGIHERLIVPIKNTPSSITPEWDKKNLITRVRVPREELLNPAQMVIYGDKVAFTSFKDCMITTIIEDKNITDTCSMMFEALWTKYKAS